MTALAPPLQKYFTERLIGQRRASPNTIAAYGHTFRLLLGFVKERTGKPPSELDLAELDAPVIAAFLDHLERVRNNSVRTRNNRLAAIHSLFSYLALQHPEHAASIARVLAIPHKRTERNLVSHLTEPEVNALISACDRSRWTGRRDYAFFRPPFSVCPLTVGHYERCVDSPSSDAGVCRCRTLTTYEDDERLRSRATMGRGRGAGGPGDVSRRAVSRAARSGSVGERGYPHLV
jgi:Phage integrase, N-terminal SAM-like domain